MYRGVAKACRIGTFLTATPAGSTARRTNRANRAKQVTQSPWRGQPVRRALHPHTHTNALAGGRRIERFGGKALAVLTIGTQHLNAWQDLALEAHHPAQIRHCRLPTEAKIAALPAIWRQVRCHRRLGQPRAAPRGRWPFSTHQSRPVRSTSVQSLSMDPRLNCPAV